MLVNKKMVRKNKGMKMAQKADRKENRDRRLEKGCALGRNIGKVVALQSESALGEAVKESAFSGSISAEELIGKTEAAGLTGMSGSGFPTADKIKTFLAAKAQRRIIIINGAECEPGLLNDAWLMRNKGSEIIDGAAALKQALAPERIILATRGSAEYLAGLDKKGLETVRLPLRYPLGEEHLLIRQLLGLELSGSVIPAGEGILVINVQTVWQLCRILSGDFDGGRFVTLADLTTGEARVAYAEKGASVTGTLSAAFPGAEGEVYFGGGIGRAEKAGEADVFSDATAFAAFSGKVLISNASPCKKCGGCTKKCPMGIKVKDIVLARQKNPSADVSALGADKCIHCGTCTYFCMAGKDPMEYVAM